LRVTTVCGSRSLYADTIYGTSEQCTCQGKVRAARPACSRRRWVTCNMVSLGALVLAAGPHLVVALTLCPVDIREQVVSGLCQKKVEFYA